jgi:hypothetical protein
MTLADPPYTSRPSAEAFRACGMRPHPIEYEKYGVHSRRHERRHRGARQTRGRERRSFYRGRTTLQRSKKGGGTCKYQAKYKHGGQRQCGRLRPKGIKPIIIAGKTSRGKKMHCSTGEPTKRENKREQARTPSVSRNDRAAIDRFVRRRHASGFPGSSPGSPPFPASTHKAEGRERHCKRLLRPAECTSPGTRPNPAPPSGARPERHPANRTRMGAERGAREGGRKPIDGFRRAMRGSTHPTSHLLLRRPSIARNSVLRILP